MDWGGNIARLVCVAHDDVVAFGSLDDVMLHAGWTVAQDDRMSNYEDACIEITRQAEEMVDE